MMQYNYTRFAARASVVVVVVLLVAVAATGAANARSVRLPEDGALTGQPDGESAGPTDDSIRSGGDEGYGICMVGVENPCNGGEWNGSQVDTDGETGTETAGSQPTPADRNEEPEFEPGFENLDPEYEPGLQDDEPEFKPGFENVDPEFEPGLQHDDPEFEAELDDNATERDPAY